jgi:putative peptidoglycan lipid II flippase
MNLLRAASTVSLLTLASRVTGLAREVMIAAQFGAGAWTDAFNVAFRIPNLLRRLFAEGAFSQAFVPLLAATRSRDGDEATHSLIDAVATVLFWVLGLTCVVGVLAAPLIVFLMAEGLEQFDAAVVMTRWMFPYIGFISLVSLAAGILNTWKHFAVPAATPLLLNLSVIAAGWWLTPYFEQWGLEPIFALAAGVLLGGVLQLSAQVPTLARLGMLPRLRLRPSAVRGAWDHPGVRKVLRQMAPAVLGVSVAHLSLIINTQIASQVAVGAVSWLNYADRLMEFPTALLGVALGVILLPQLSAAQAKADTATYSGLLDWGLRMVLLLALPCAVALLVFPKPMIAVLFHHGEFTTLAVEKSSVALQGYGVGLLGLIGVKILAPGFYARQDIRTPVKIAVVVLILTQVMNLIFVPQIGHAGLALSIGIGALINATWLFIGLRRAGAYVPLPGWGLFALRVILASAALGALLAWGAHSVDWIGLREQGWQRTGWLAAYLSGAAVLYFGILWAVGVNPRQFVRRG